MIAFFQKMTAMAHYKSTMQAPKACYHGMMCYSDRWTPFQEQISPLDSASSWG